MTSPSDDTAKPAELSAAVSQTWKRFLEVYEPLRPELYRFCRYLSRSPWDAEDLVQDTLARAFATLGGMVEFELRPHRGEILLLSWYAHHDGERVRAVSRVELSADGDRIARLRNYYYTPELVAEVCGELDLPYRTNGTFRARAAA